MTDTHTENSDQNILPLLPLRDIVVFPQMIVPLFVGREKSVTALEKAMDVDKTIFLVTQRETKNDAPEQGDVFEIGTVGIVRQFVKLPDGTVKVLVEGGRRAKLLEMRDDGDHYSAKFEYLAEHKEDDDKEKQEIDALTRAVMAQFEQYIKLNRKIPSDALAAINQVDDPDKLADTLASHLPMKLKDKQKFLETLSVKERLEKIYSYVEEEIGVLEVEKSIRKRVKGQMEKTQRDYYLNEQIKAIQKE